MTYPISYMLDMPTVDKTQEWEEGLNENNSELKFPVTFLASIGDESLEIEKSNIDIGKPRLRKSSVKEIKLGKKTNKKKGNELF